MVTDETVNVVLEEAEIVDCEGDLEADDENIQYHLYALNRNDSNAVAYKVVHVSNRENNELSIATPVNNTVQLLTTPMNGPLYVLSNSNEIVTSESVRSATPCVTKLQVEGSQNMITGIKKVKIHTDLILFLCSFSL